MELYGFMERAVLTTVKAAGSDQVPGLLYTNGVWHENLWTGQDEWHVLTANSVRPGREAG